MQKESMIRIALAHLSMIAQAARGDYKAQVEDVDRREAWLISLLRTGEGVVTDADLEIAGMLRADLAGAIKPENVMNTASAVV